MTCFFSSPRRLLVPAGVFGAWRGEWMGCLCICCQTPRRTRAQAIACPPAGGLPTATGPRGRFSLRAGGFGNFGDPPPALTACGGDTIKLTAKRRTHEETLSLHTENNEKLKAWLEALSHRTYRVREDKPVRRVPNPYDF